MLNINKKIKTPKIKKMLLSFYDYDIMHDVMYYALYVRTDFQVETKEKVLILKNISRYMANKLTSYVRALNYKCDITRIEIIDNAKK